MAQLSGQPQSHLGSVQSFCIYYTFVCIIYDNICIPYTYAQHKYVYTYIHNMYIYICIYIVNMLIFIPSCTCFLTGISHVGASSTIRSHHVGFSGSGSPKGCRRAGPIGPCAIRGHGTGCGQPSSLGHRRALEQKGCEAAVKLGE